MKLLFILFFSSVALFSYAQNSEHFLERLDSIRTVLLNKSVSLITPVYKMNPRGENATFVFKNELDSAVSLELKQYNQLVYHDDKYSDAIEENNEAEYVFRTEYPGFIYAFDNLEHRLFCAPGSKTIVKLFPDTNNTIVYEFEGDYVDENRYYRDLNLHFENSHEHEWSQFYRKLDTMGSPLPLPKECEPFLFESLEFLTEYEGCLSQEFYLYEYWRLIYNYGWRVRNAFISKYRFIDLWFIEDEFLDYIFNIPSNRDRTPVDHAFLEFQSNKVFSLISLEYNKQRNSNEKFNWDERRRYYTDSILKDSLYHDWGMMHIYANGFRSKTEIKERLAKTNFYDAQNREIIDSLLQKFASIPKEGDHAPSLRLKDINGKQFRLQEHYGESVLINFWSASCSPCIRNFKKENEMVEQYKEEGLIIVNVCIETSVDRWKKLTEKHNLKMINLYANEEQTNRLMKSYALYSLPRSVLINPFGKVIKNTVDINDPDFDKYF